MPQPPGNAVASAGNILLVEEYAALASAFATALRQAAPELETRVVRSLAEAETAVRDRISDLLVLDADPAPRGALAFFKRLKTAAPNMRVLVIGAHDAGDVTREPNGPAAFQFIRKPFQLDEFRAAVRALLDPAPGLAGGTLRDFGVVDLLVFYAVGEASTILQVETPGGRTGEIHFSDGRIRHALVVGHTGREALIEILRWPTPRLRELDRRANVPGTVHGSWHSVLVEALHALPPRERLLAFRATPPLLDVPATTRWDKKVLVIDDTELLLVFVDEILSTAIPRVQVVTAASGRKGAEAAAAEKPDLILLDYSLPDIHGGEVCELLLANEATARVPVIMMSGHVPEMLAVEKRYKNVIATIAKPFLSNALIELVERTLTELPKTPPEKAKQPPPVPAEPAPHKKKDQAIEGNGNHGSAAPEIPDQAREKTATPDEKPSPAEVEAIAPLAGEIVRKLNGLTSAPAETASRNSVVLTIPLEAVSIRFSPALRVTAIRARPSSAVVSLHILPQSAPGQVIPEAIFEMARVHLDARGQIDTVRITPTTRHLPAPEPGDEVAVAGIFVLPANGGSAIELRPASAAPMRLQLIAMMELAGVELSAGFGVGYLILKWHEGKIRVHLETEGEESGIAFESARVFLDRSAKIAELLLDAVA